MLKFARISILLLVNTVFIAAVLAENFSPLSDLAATAENSPSVNFPARLTLEKIAINSDRDFLTFRVNADNSPVNLHGLSFYDDKDFKTVNQDFLVPDGSLVQLVFGSGEKDDAQKLQLFTDKKGLTATTDQILLHSGNQYLDFFCWYRDPPGKTELADFQKIRRDDFWPDSDISSCFPSTGIAKNQVLTRNSDQHNVSAWQIEHSPYAAASVKTTTTKTSTAKSSAAKKSSKTPDLTGLLQSSTETPTSTLLQITEIYPMPPDKNDFEWVEIKNISASAINLQNWIIDDSDGGSKPRRLTEKPLGAGEIRLLNLKNYKITLNNDSDSVRLFRPGGQLESEQTYGSGQKGQSYALIYQDGQEKWLWTDHPTAGLPNPVLTSVSGTIDLPAQFGQQYHFGLTAADGQKILVNFDEEIIKGPLAKQVFTTGSVGTFTGELLPAPANTNQYSQILKLYNYEITGQSENISDSLIYVIIAIIVALTTVTYLVYQYFHSRKWKPSASAIF